MAVSIFALLVIAKLMLVGLILRPHWVLAVFALLGYAAVMIQLCLLPGIPEDQTICHRVGGDVVNGLCKL